MVSDSAQAGDGSLLLPVESRSIDESAPQDHGFYGAQGIEALESV